MSPSDRVRKPRPVACLAPLFLVAAAAHAAAGCGALGNAAQDSTSRCQRLSDKYSLCPDELFGRGAISTFLDEPGALHLAARGELTSSLPAALGPSQKVQACAFRLSGSSEPCQAAFGLFVACVEVPVCSALPAACASPLAQLKAACAAMFIQP